MSYQKVNPYQPMISEKVGPSPVIMKVGMPVQMAVSEGVPVGSLKVETYVRLSALPEELRLRVETAIQFLSAGM